MAKVYDMDAALGEGDPIETLPFKLFGQEWLLLCEFNAFSTGQVMAGGDQALAAFSEMLVNMVVPEQRNAFGKALASNPRKIDWLVKLSQDLTEKAANRPSESPASSSASRAPRTSGRKSTVVSS